MHISNIHQREEFRHHSFVSRVAAGVICGFGTQGYVLALQRLARQLGTPGTPKVQAQGAFLVGLIGAGIQASLTPAMHEREGAAQGLRYIYRLIDLTALGLGAEALAELVAAAQRMGFAGLNITHPANDTIVIAILSVAFFGQGMVGLGWTVISDIAPKKLMGLTGGLFNFATNLSGIITPLAIGYIIKATGSFVGALIFVSAIALLGAFSYIFILGDVRRIELENEAAER